MHEIQKLLVDDHIQQIGSDALAARARRADASAADRSARRPTADHRSSVRLRLGRWLVGIGEAIAGPPLTDDDKTTMPNAA